MAVLMRLGMCLFDYLDRASQLGAAGVGTGAHATVEAAERRWHRKQK